VGQPFLGLIPLLRDRDDANRLDRLPNIHHLDENPSTSWPGGAPPLTHPRLVATDRFCLACLYGARGCDATSAMIVLQPDE